jgi:hypothetical protein
VGTLGTALTADHARVLCRLCETIVLVFDGDEAGQRAADRAIEVLFSHPVDLRICVLPGGLDPDELLRQPGGSDRFCRSVEEAEDALTFKVRRFSNRLEEAGTAAARERLLNEFLRELADLGFGGLQGVRKRWVVGRLSELLGITVDEVVRAIPRRGGRPTRGVMAPASGSSQAAESAPLLKSVSRARRLAEHDLLAILIFEPSAGTLPLSLGGADPRPVTEWFGPADFADPEAGPVVEVVHARLAAGVRFTVNELLDALQDETHRRLASSLYFLGEQRCGRESERVTDALNEAAQALHGCIERERSERRTREQPLAALGEDERVGVLATLIEERRRRGDVAAAIGRGVRG